jgi:dihydrofolate reductase
MGRSQYDLSIIVAVDHAGGYANGREIPWSHEADWKHFKSVTKGNVCVMGRRTYEDITERRKKRSPNFRVLLPQRESFVISRTLEDAQGATIERSIYLVDFIYGSSIGIRSNRSG